MKFLLKFAFIFVVLGLPLLPVFGQSTKRPRKVKKPVIQETVIVKGNPYTRPIYPAETDPGIWNEFSSKDGRIKLTFPSLPGKLSEDSELTDGGKVLISMSAHTSNASYKLFARHFAPIADSKELNEILERSISTVFAGPRSKVVEKKNVSYGGIIGKEFMILERKADSISIQFARVYILGDQLITLFVIPDKPESQEKMKPWIQKFFDSLSVPLPARNEA